MEVGQWARTKDKYGSPLLLRIIQVGVGCGPQARALDMVDGFFLFGYWDVVDLEPTTPTPAELEQWRTALAKVGLCLSEEADALRQERDELKRLFDTHVGGTPIWDDVYSDIVNLRKERDTLRDTLESVMEWAEHFATPMSDELKQTVRELLKEKADD